MQTEEKALILYFYDAMCGWCYGFGPVMKKAAEVFSDEYDFVAVSGGMITGERVAPISTKADFIKGAYKRVEETTGIVFGDAYLKLLDEGTYLMNSVKPGIAMSVFKSFLPFRSVEFAHDMQEAHMYHGKDLNTRDVYFELIKKYELDENEFLSRLNSEQFQEQTFQEFEEVQRIGITGFPAVVLQYNKELALVNSGYTDYENLAKRLLVAHDSLKAL